MFSKIIRKLKERLILKNPVKVCKGCNKSLSISLFSKNKNTKDGLQVWCKDCVSAWYQTHKIRHLELAYAHRRKHPIRTWCAQVRKSHKNNGFNVLITNDELQNYINTHMECEICCKPFDFTPFKGHATKDSPSLDRKYNESEIRIDNIMMLCNDCNRKKGDMPFDKYVVYCLMIWNKFKDVKVNEA